MDRRSFLAGVIKTGALATAWPLSASVNVTPPRLPISLSQWTWERDIFGTGRDNHNWFRQTLATAPQAVLKGPMAATDIVDKARMFGVNGIDLVSTMFAAHRDDKGWLREFRQRAEAAKARFVCLMADTQYRIGDSDGKRRQLSVAEHKQWVDAAAELGCQHVRVNPFGDGSYLDMLKRCADSLRQLAPYAQKQGVGLTIENHGHPSSNGAWTQMLIDYVADPNVGVFLDLGNFFMGGFSVRPRRWYDSHQGMLDLAPYALGISAKTKEFNAEGDEKNINYARCATILREHNFNGWLSAEYAGKTLTSDEGAAKTIALLKRHFRV